MSPNSTCQRPGPRGSPQLAGLAGRPRRSLVTFVDSRRPNLRFAQAYTRFSKRRAQQRVSAPRLKIAFRPRGLASLPAACDARPIACRCRVTPTVSQHRAYPAGSPGFFVSRISDIRAWLVQRLRNRVQTKGCQPFPDSTAPRLFPDLQFWRSSPVDCRMRAPGGLLSSGPRRSWRVGGVRRRRQIVRAPHRLRGNGQLPQGHRRTSSVSVLRLRVAPDAALLL